MMAGLHERAAALNRVNDRIALIERELTHVTLAKSWQWVHVRKRELRALYLKRARLEKGLK